MSFKIFKMNHRSILNKLLQWTDCQIQNLKSHSEGDIFSSRFLVSPGREAPQHPIAPFMPSAFWPSRPHQHTASLWFSHASQIILDSLIIFLGFSCSTEWHESKRDKKRLVQDIHQFLRSSKNVTWKAAQKPKTSTIFLETWRALSITWAMSRPPLMFISSPPACLLTIDTKHHLLRGQARAL